MKFYSTVCTLFLSLLILVYTALNAQAERTTIDLSQYNWGIVRDFDAEWINDEIHLPPVDVAKLPVNPPSFGWSGVKEKIEKTVHLPATIEEHFWADHGNTEGVAGDYRGVSWWITNVSLNSGIERKRVYLDFDSVHFRAEVFVNRKLMGYDVIGHTPFSVNITDAVRPGAVNEIAVRITDPLGNFSWNDRAVLKWGEHDIPPCHGFGGITGKVVLRVVDRCYTDDVYVQNKPSITDVDIIAEIKNTTTDYQSGTLTVKIYPEKEPGTVLWEKSFKEKLEESSGTYRISIDMPEAEIWHPDNPNLYFAEVTFETDDGSRDTATQRFGFRWFDMGEKNGDKRFYLNGKRIVLKSGMSWGFWPVNGVFPTPELAVRDIQVAKELGLNLMNFHRAIGQPILMDTADERGLLCYEESGGYSCEGADQNATLWRKWRREKLLRMVKRDRSRPSLIIYNLQNRTPNGLTPEDVGNMKTVHTMDPSRIITYMSGFWKPLPEEHPTKLFFRPYDDTEYYSGWYDMHMFSPCQSYSDEFYNTPEDFTRYYATKSDIVFWGEDGAINNPPRLQLAKEYHEKNNVQYGWLGKYYTDWHDAYDSFLDRSGFRAFFPDVDAMTTSIGDVSLYYHGRIMENIRAGNISDCYTINGWAANHLANQCDIADLYRNPVGDPEILARYCAPLYVAVKLRNKVVPSGTTVTADFYIVNEAGLKGKHTLTVMLEGGNGGTDFKQTYPVMIEGGEEYGQLLVESVDIPLDNHHGYFTVKAELTDRQETLKAKGSDRIFSVDISGMDLSRNGAVIDTSGTVNRVLKKSYGFTLPNYDDVSTEPDYVVIGKNTFKRSRDITHLLELVRNGSCVVVIDGADMFADFISSSNSSYFATDYRGRYTMSRGNFIAGKHELLEGLPQAQAFNWEYQVFNYHRRQNIFALRLDSAETVVAAVSGIKKEVGTALAVIPFGRGRIILSTLNLMSWLDSDTPQSVTAKRLFGNFIAYASGKNDDRK